MRQASLVDIAKPALTLAPQFAAVIKFIQTALRERQSGLGPAYLRLNIGDLLAGQPLTFGAGAFNFT